MIGDIVGGAISAAFSGDASRLKRMENLDAQIEARVKPRAEALEQRAEGLCRRMVALDRLDNALEYRRATASRWTCCGSTPAADAPAAVAGRGAPAALSPTYRAVRATGPTARRGWRCRIAPATIGFSRTAEPDMAELKEARVPDIGDYDGVPVIELLVAVGDTVAQDQGLVTLESDKATMEVPAPFAGVVRELKVKLGDSLAEGSVVALIEPSERRCRGARHAGRCRQPADAAAAPASPPVSGRRNRDPGRTGRRRRAGRPARPARDRIQPRGPGSACRDRGRHAAQRSRGDAAAHAAGRVHRRRTDARQGAVREPGGAPVRARARRRPDRRSPAPSAAAASARKTCRSSSRA